MIIVLLLCLTCYNVCTELVRRQCSSPSWGLKTGRNRAEEVSFIFWVLFSSRAIKMQLDLGNGFFYDSGLAGHDVIHRYRKRAPDLV